MSDIICRAMVENDIDRVAQLEKQCFPTPWSKAALCSELSNPQARYLVLEQHGQVIAYAGMWLIIDEAHITNIGVDEAHRRKGLGDRLMREMMKAALVEDVNKMTLEVRVSNTAARELYVKLGFEQFGVRKRYYSNNDEDALILWNNDISPYVWER